MTMPERTPRPPDDVDALLRATLADDLPPDVEARLQNRVERFVEERRGGPAAARWVAPPFSFDVRLLRVAASVVLIVCGIVLHAAGRPGALAGSVERVNDSVTLWEAVRRASSVACAGEAREDLGSPADLANRLFDRWALEDSCFDRSERATVLTFRATAERARYRLVLDPGSGLPRRVVKTRLDAAPAGPAAAAYDSVCTWGNR